jgi:hypothetical protein
MRINEIPDIERRIIETENTSTGVDELGLAMVSTKIYWEWLWTPNSSPQGYNQYSPTAIN